MSDSTRLKWDDLSAHTFKITIIPYFQREPCSVSGCIEKGRYLCKYKLHRKVSKHNMNDREPNPKISFHICENHEKEEFLKLSYDRDYIEEEHYSYESY